MFTGGESVVYGLVPGLLNMVWPSLFWGHLLDLVLFVATSLAITRWLGLRRDLYWACILASPALVSYAIAAYPYVPSTTIPYALAIAWVLSPRQAARRLWWGLALDLLVFAAIGGFAFNGYEVGKTVFVVPAVAAATVRSVPPVRKLGWLALAAGLGWLVFRTQAGSTTGTLAAIPAQPVAFARGLAAFVAAYADPRKIDYPGLALAGVLALPSVRTQRPFWVTLFVLVTGLVSLSTFSTDRAFLTPHRFLLLAFVAALVVSLALSEARRWTPALTCAACLVAAGVVYTSYRTARFALYERPATAHTNAPNVERVYSLPYHRALLDQQIWPTRIRDAMTLSSLVRHTTEAHLVFYGFSIVGEDTVNPQFLPSRLILSLGFPTFHERVFLVDHFKSIFFDFPISPLAEVSTIAAGLPVPFFVHVHEPEYSAPAVLATYFNHARVTPVDLGLAEFRSFRVDQFAPAGPIPIRPLPGAPGTVPSGEDGYCLASVRPIDPGIDLTPHDGRSVAEHLDAVLAWHHERVSRRVVTSPVLDVAPRSVTQLEASLDNTSGSPRWARLETVASDQVMMLVNGQPVLEVLREGPPAPKVAEVLLPPGRSVLRVVQYQNAGRGRFAFSSADADGQPLRWHCDAARDGTGAG